MTMDFSNKDNNLIQYSVIHFNSIHVRLLYFNLLINSYQSQLQSQHKKSNKYKHNNNDNNNQNVANRPTNWSTKVLNFMNNWNMSTNQGFWTFFKARPVFMLPCWLAGSSLTDEGKLLKICGSLGYFCKHYSVIFFNKINHNRAKWFSACTWVTFQYEI